MPDETVVFLYPSISLLLTLVLVNSKAKILKIISLIAFAGLIVSHLFQIYFYLSIFKIILSQWRLVQKNIN